MNISVKYRDYIIDIFKDLPYGFRTVYTDIEDSRTYRYLELDLTKKILEVPICVSRDVYSQIYQIVKGEKKNLGLEKLLIDFESKAFINLGDRQIPSSLIFGFGYKDGTFVKVNLKGSIYYIAHGIVLDHLLHPLLIYTIDLDLVKDSNFMISLNPKVYIDPKVYENNKQPIEKHIILRLIPSIVSSKVWLPQFGSYIASDDNQDHKVKIIITDLSNYFLKINKPDNLQNINEDLNQLIVDNLESMIYESR